MNKTMTAIQQRTAFKPLFPVHVSILQRKCACGNHTIGGGECADCAQKKVGLQRKLAIGASNDPLEQEADRIADQVMAEPGRGAVSSIPVKVQRFTGNPSGQTAEAPASVERVLASPGQPLEPGVREDMEGRFGHDFSQVRVHTGGAAEQSAREVNANAYTVGNNVMFGVGQYAPTTNEGERLIAHELTHTIQEGHAAHTIRRSATDPSWVSAESVYRTLSQDSIYETLAHEMAYPVPVPSEQTPDTSPRRHASLSERQLRRLEQLGFIPTDVVVGDLGFQMIGFIPTNDERGSRRFPVLAFKGSENLQSWVDDLNPGGIGHGQFTRNLSRIDQLVDSMGGRVDVTGHSLGGTLAQLYAITSPTKVKRVVTFQAPGLPVGYIDWLVARNQSNGLIGDVESTHYRAIGDYVDRLGYGFTPGIVFEIPTELLAPLEEPRWRDSIGARIVAGEIARAYSAHSSYPLARLNLLRREHPSLFRLFQIYQHQTATGGDARGFRRYEILRQLASIAHPLLERLFADDRVRDRIIQDPEYLRLTTYEQKVELIRILAAGIIEDDDLGGIVRIIRAMTLEERQRFREELFEPLFPNSSWDITVSTRRVTISNELWSRRAPTSDPGVSIPHPEASVSAEATAPETEPESIAEADSVSSTSEELGSDPVSVARDDNLPSYARRWLNLAEALTDDPTFGLLASHLRRRTQEILNLSSLRSVIIEENATLGAELRSLSRTDPRRAVISAEIRYNNQQLEISRNQFDRLFMEAREIFGLLNRGVSGRARRGPNYRELQSSVQTDQVFGTGQQYLLSVDHIVSIAQIIRMPSFDRLLVLDFDAAMRILDLRENLIVLPQSANSARGDLSWADWSGWSPIVRNQPELWQRIKADFVAREIDLHDMIQQEILQALGESN